MIKRWPSGYLFPVNAINPINFVLYFDRESIGSTLQRIGRIVYKNSKRMMTETKRNLQKRIAKKQIDFLTKTRKQNKPTVNNGKFELLLKNTRLKK